jgi:hypothetical protein
VLVGLLAALAALAGCGSGGGSSSPAATSATAPTSTAAETTSTGATDTGTTETGAGETGALAAGQIRVRYVSSQDPTVQAYENVLKQSGLLESIANDVDAAVTLPRRVTIWVQQTGSPDLVYDRAKAAIIVPVEWLVYLDTLFFRAKLAKTVPDQQALVLAATALVVHHELAHALVDQLDLPLTGSAETAAAQVETLLVSRHAKMAAQVAKGAATLAGLDAKPHGLEDAVVDASAYWAKHFPNKRAFDDIVCWLYGSEPDGLAGVTGEPDLATCRQQFEQATAAARQLLGAHLR